MSEPTVPMSEASYRVLRELADQTGQAVPEVLARALEDYRRKVFLERVNAAYNALRDDPKAWAEVEAERRSMAGSLMDGLDPNERWGEDGETLPPVE